MKLTIIGAAHEVTGSCHYLEAAGKNILIDCGLEQGLDLYENPGLPIGANEIDFVLLTHAHIDHSGKLPYLYKNGFKGEIITTFATADLCNIMLRDSAHIQEFEAEWQNRKGRRAGLPPLEPLYEMADAIGAIELLSPRNYGERTPLCQGIEFRFTDVGHLLGSACIEVWITEGELEKKIVFSGDIGNVNLPIIKNPSYVHEGDFVVVESTYGDRNHSKEKVDHLDELTKVLRETFVKGGNVVIPSFAVGRTQELLYFFREIKEQNLLNEYPDFEVYLDSPLATLATEVFSLNRRDCFDKEALRLVDSGINPLVFPGLKVAITSDDSRMINMIAKPIVIISASGMCEAGRIRHHLKHNLWRKESTILFAGYQASGTLGRHLLEGVDEVKIFGETIEVRARIEVLKGVSGHADKEGLLNWLEAFSTPFERVIVVHGEDKVTDEFASIVAEKLECKTWAPYPLGEIDLATNEVITDGVIIPVVAGKAASKKAASAFERLVAAGRRLLEVIHKNEGLSNKDKAKFESQINNLADRWDV